MRVTCKTFGLTLLLIASLSGCVTARKIDPDQAGALRKQADAWDSAIVRRDVAAISQNMAESFQQIDSHGNLSNKVEFLTGITSDKLIINPYQPVDVVIRFYGATALLSGGWLTFKRPRFPSKLVGLMEEKQPPNNSSHPS